MRFVQTVARIFGVVFIGVALLGVITAVTVVVSRVAADNDPGARRPIAAIAAPTARKQSAAPMASKADAARAGTPSLNAPMIGTYRA